MEAKVAQIHDLQDGEMREVVVGKTKVLLVHFKGKFYAIGGECTHYGGPLAEGALSGRRAPTRPAVGSHGGVDASGAGARAGRIAPEPGV